MQLLNMKIDKMAIVNLDKMKYNEQGNDLLQTRMGSGRMGLAVIKVESKQKMLRRKGVVLVQMRAKNHR